ncbi:MAG: ribosome silencing factor [bacterium]
MSFNERRTQANHRMNFRNLAKQCAGLALAKKAKEILILDVRKLTSITDYFVICSGRSNIHVDTIAEWIVSKLKGKGIRPLHIEGEKQAQWVLIDYIGIIVHVFYEPIRKFYGLERLWTEGRKVKFQEEERKNPEKSNRL